MDYDRQHGVRDSVDDRCNREEPCGEQSDPVASLNSNRGENPDAQPRQVENNEEAVRPWRRAEQRGKAVLKSRDKLLCEVQALRGEPDREEACRPVTGDGIGPCRYTEDRQEERDDSTHGKPGRSREDAAQVSGQVSVHGDI